MGDRREEKEMNGKDIIKCIKAAEMKLTKKETSALMSISYKRVVKISKEYGIKFIDGGQRSDEARRQAGIGPKPTSTINHDRDRKETKPAQPTAAARNTIRIKRDTSKGHYKRKLKKRLQDILHSDLDRSVKHELVYAAAWQEHQRSIKKKTKVGGTL
jgi:glutaredoxin 2